MLYHASCVSGLKRLEPHVSTHQIPYVYAIRSKLAAMLFGAPKDDFDLLISVEGSRPVLYECYPEALKKVYSGKKCSIYTVSESGFLTGRTGWEEELVCPTSVDVVREDVVEDIYTQLMCAAEKEQCIIHSFTPAEHYLSFLREELQERIRIFGMTEEEMQRDIRFLPYHHQLFGKSIQTEF